MAVRESLLGIMTLGPVYGLQLHAELGSRAPHRWHTNVGQIYGTLDRLGKAGLVGRTGQTTEGFPLYSLTAEGQSVAHDWLYGASLVDAHDWNDVLDHVLIARSIDSVALSSVLGVYEQILTRDPAVSVKKSESHGGSFSTQNLAEAAERRFGDACLAWLGDVRRDMSSQSEPYGAHGFLTARNRRGRPVAG